VTWRGRLFARPLASVGNDYVGHAGHAGQDRSTAPVIAASSDRAWGRHTWRATTIDRLEAQFVVPGLVAIDLAQSVPGAVFGQPRPGIDGPDVDSVAGHVSRRVRGGDPSGSFLCRPVFRDGPAKELILVLRERQPLLTENSMPSSAAAVAASRRARSRSGVEVGYAGIPVIQTQSRPRGGRRQPQ